MKNKIICYVTTLFSCFFFISCLIVAPAKFLIKVSRYNWLQVLLAITTVVLIFAASCFIFYNLNKYGLSEIEMDGLRWATITEDGDLIRISAGEVASFWFAAFIPIYMTLSLNLYDKSLLPYNIVSPKKAEFLNNKISQLEDELKGVDMSSLTAAVLLLLVFIITYLSPILFAQKPSLYWIDKLCRHFILKKDTYQCVSIILSFLYYGFISTILFEKIAKPVSTILTKELLSREWEQNFSALQRFHKREGHCCVPRGHLEDGLNLGNWVGRQRFNKERLMPDLLKRLNSLGFVW